MKPVKDPNNCRTCGCIAVSIKPVEIFCPRDEASVSDTNAVATGTGVVLPTTRKFPCLIVPQRSNSGYESLEITAAVFESGPRSITVHAPSQHVFRLRGYPARGYPACRCLYSREGACDPCE